MTQEERSREALRRVQNPSMSNFGQVIAGFMEKGIPQDQISPKENCFTFWAWKGLGYSVRKGEHGVKVTTWIPIQSKQEAEAGKKPSRFRPKSTTVFHISQVEPTDPNAPKDDMEAAWDTFKARMAQIDLEAQEEGEQADDSEAAPTPETRRSALESSRMAEMRRLAGVR